MVDGKSPEWLPPGFTKKFKCEKGRKLKIYTELSSGETIYSRATVNRRYLSSVHPADTAVQQTKPCKVNEPLPKKKMKNGSFEPVACVSTAADGLPRGWIKDTIVSSKYGSKDRRDSYYTSPDSDYVFRSTEDALKFLKNGDIRCCASIPLKKEYLQLKKNRIPSSNRDNGNASEDLQSEEQFIPVKELCDGTEFSLEKDDNSEQANGVSKELIEKRSNNSRKRKKRKDEPSLRASKRLAKCEPEILVLNESAARNSAVITLPKLCDPPKEEKPRQQLNKIENPLLPVEEEQKKQRDEFEECWPDPYLEYVFKTVTGQISTQKEI